MAKLIGRTIPRIIIQAIWASALALASLCSVAPAVYAADTIQFDADGTGSAVSINATILK